MLDQIKKVADKVNNIEKAKLAYAAVPSSPAKKASVREDPSPKIIKPVLPRAAHAPQASGGRINARVRNDPTSH